MSEDIIVCPYCEKRITLSKALAGQIEERVKERFELEFGKREREMTEQFEERLASERKSAAAKASKELKAEVADLSGQLNEKSALLDKAHKEELALRRRQRELDEKAKSLDLEVARKLDEQSRQVEKDVSQRISEEHRLKDREKDGQLEALRRTIDDLKRKAEQGSQQAQGEAGEMELENALRSAFSQDTIEPVSKGVRGGDVIHHVRTSSGACCGSILWECKVTKNWSDAWLMKLKDDQRSCKAELGVLVTAVLPMGVGRFSLIDGVWVTDFECALGLAMALRSQLVRLQSVDLAAQGKASKMELVYAYLSGTEFRQRIEAIVEAFRALSHDLDRERAAMLKYWGKREQQIGKVLENVAGLYGSVQGIVGASLPDIEQLELEAAPVAALPGPQS